MDLEDGGVPREVAAVGRVREALLRLALLAGAQVPPTTAVEHRAVAEDFDGSDLAPTGLLAVAADMDEAAHSFAGIQKSRG